MTYSKGPRDGIETNMYFVDKIGWIADTAEGTPRINVVLPSVQFFVPLQRQIEPLVPRFKE